MTSRGDRDDAGEAARRARRRAEVFGDVVPEQTRDDREPDESRGEGGGEQWLRDNVPPHHGS